MRVEVIGGAGEMQALFHGLRAAHPKVMETALKGEGFRLKTVLDETLAAGVGPPRSPLTRAEGLTKGLAALSAFSPQSPKPTGKRMPYPAYSVQRSGRGIELMIGWTRWITRGRTAAGRRRTTLVTVFAGGSHRIDREEQATIARRIRRRLGEPVRRRRRGRLFPKRRRFNWSDIRILIPRVGEVLHWPERAVVDQVAQRERARIPEDLATLYEAALTRKRWARTWWTATAGEVRLRQGDRILRVLG